VSVDMWMSKKLITIRQDDPASLAFELLLTNNIRHLPVVTRTHKLVGIITDRDLNEAVIPADPARTPRSMYHTVKNIKAEKIMTPNPVTVGAGTSIQDAAQILLDRKIDCLPVKAANGRLVGILTSTDILKAFIEFTRILEDTRRIDIAMDSDKYSGVLEEFQNNGVPLVSVGITHDPSSDKTIFSFRTGNKDLSRITQKLTEMGYEFFLDG
jgi:acetoin utilization protein AcuB